MSYWIALMVAIAMNIGANVSLKLAIRDIPVRDGSSRVLGILADWHLWAGGLMAVLLLASYLYSIRRIQLSIAYPTVTGLAMVGIAIMSAWLLNEPLSGGKAIGIGMVLAGSFLLFRAA